MFVQNRSVGYFFLLKKISAIFLGCIACFCAQAAVIHSGDTDLAIGDFVQLFLPGLGLGISLYMDDSEGTQQWLKSTGSTMLATQVLKQSFANTSWGTRPSGASKSFPSGHTSSACSGASFIGTRYGWEYGVPGMVMAAYVGYTRVDEEQHHWRDVIVGCALGLGFNYEFVTPKNEQSTVNLTVTDEGVPIVGYQFHF